MKKNLICSTLLTSLFLSQLAFADDPTKAQCIDADTQSQSTRSAGKLAATRDLLQICANAACPSLVRDDCAQRIDEINRVQPSVVFSAKNGAGADLVDVTVTMDGQPLTQKLDGHPLAVDPGDHTFVFSVPGEAPVTQHFVLAESEKNRRESITIGKAPATPLGTSGTASEANADTRDPNAGKTQRILGLGVAGVGVVGVAIGAIFGITASSSWSSAQSDCPNAGKCKPQASDERSTALTQATVSTIGFIAGGVLVAGGAVLFFTAPKHKDITVGIAPAPGGAFLRGSF